MLIFANIEAEKLQDGKYINVKKGQGSNTQVNIGINIEGRDRPRFTMCINAREDGSTDLALVDHGKPFPNEVWRTKIKGEKQKGECVYHGVVNCSRCDEFKQ